MSIVLLTSYRAALASLQVEYNGIYSQESRVGFNETTYMKVGDKLIITANMSLKLMILGSENTIDINTVYVIEHDKIMKYIFSMDSSDLTVKSEGNRKGNSFLVTNTTVSGESKFTVPIDQEPVAASYVYRWLAKKGLNTGDVHSFILFEPSAFLLGPDISKQKTSVRVLDKEKISVSGAEYDTFKLSILSNGSDSTVWIAKDGELIKDVSSIGLTAIKEEENMTSSIIRSRVDINERTAISSNDKITNPRKLRRLKIRMSGINSYGDFDIDDNYRQFLKNNILNIRMESVDSGADINGAIYDGKAEYLEDSNYIQSKDPEIKKLAVLITQDKKSTYDKIDSIKTWVYENIEKKPTISIPNALDILKTRKGDCNEHAVLFAALARASNVPTKIALGIVYINGKFYYHAWNEVYMGKWITVDSTFNQFPADASHVKFLQGDLKRSSELIKVVGKLKIEVLDAS